MSLGAVDLLQIGVISDALDPGLQWNDLVQAHRPADDAASTVGGAPRPPTLQPQVVRAGHPAACRRASPR